MCSSSCSYFQDTSIVWKLCWRCGTVVRVRGELSGWDGVGFVMCCQEDFLHAVLSSWVEMNFDDDVEEESDCCLRKSGKSGGLLAIMKAAAAEAGVRGL